MQRTRPAEWWVFTADPTSSAGHIIALGPKGMVRFQEIGVRRLLAFCTPRRTKLVSGLKRNGKAFHTVQLARKRYIALHPFAVLYERQEGE